MRLKGLPQIAKEVGMTPGALQNRAKRGQFIPRGQNKFGKLYDLDEVKAVLDLSKEASALQDRGAYLRDGANGGGQCEPESKNKASDGARLLKSKAESAAMDVKLKEIKLETQQGELIRKDLVREQDAQIASVLNGIIDAWPGKVASEMAAMGKAGAKAHDFRMKLIARCNDLKLAMLTGLDALDIDR
jgi:hypothetical protein